MQGHNEDYSEKIRKNIKRFRKEKHLSQEKLSELVNCSREHLSRVESGKLQLGLPLFINLAKVFEVSLDEMIL
ncbi:MAG: helix-turn-helix transcriptional regulator [bacterium]|nr:helix-turn-helix transcriptional regulator [bacterium]